MTIYLSVREQQDLDRVMSGLDTVDWQGMALRLTRKLYGKAACVVARSAPGEPSYLRLQVCTYGQARVTAYGFGREAWERLARGLQDRDVEQTQEMDR